jgi:hypothetical protein
VPCGLNTTDAAQLVHPVPQFAIRVLSKHMAPDSYLVRHRRLVMLLTALGITVVGAVLVVWRLRVESRMGAPQGNGEHEEDGDEEAGIHSSGRAATPSEPHGLDVGARLLGSRVTGAPAGFAGQHLSSDGSATPTPAGGPHHARHRPASALENRSSADHTSHSIDLVRTASQGGRPGSSQAGRSAPARNQDASLLD